MEEKLDRIEKNIKDLTGIMGVLAEKTAHIEEVVDVLARSVAEGFAKTEERFEQIDQKFEQIDERFEKVDQQFEGTNGKIEGLHRRMDAELEERKKLEDTVSKISVHVFPELAK